MTRDAQIDELLVVYYKDGSSGHCVVSDAPAIDAALVKWAGDGGDYIVIEEARDSIVRMTALNGSRLVMMASFIVGYSISTRGNRRLRVVHEQALDAENTDLKSPGIPKPVLA